MTATKIKHEIITLEQDEKPVLATSRVLVINLVGQVLVAKASATADNPDKRNLIELPGGGKVDSGESLFEAAIREAKEETGLVVRGAGRTVLYDSRPSRYVEGSPYNGFTFEKYVGLAFASDHKHPATSAEHGEVFYLGIKNFLGMLQTQPELFNPDVARAVSALANSGQDGLIGERIGAKNLEIMKSVI